MMRFDPATQDTRTSQIVHFVTIVLIVAYVVFVKKSSRVVESVPSSAKIVRTPSTYEKGSKV